MPVFHGENNGGSNNRGDIILKFKIEMPRYLTVSNEEEIRKALSETNIVNSH